jgi:nucleoid DNA-binding protein
MANTDTKIKAAKDKQSKAEIITSLCEETGMAKKEVKAVLTALSNQAQRHLISRGSGEFVVPELGVKLRRVKRPATKARKGRNPFTGEEIMIKAKPARLSIKATPLKALKDLIN